MHHGFRMQFVETKKRTKQTALAKRTAFRRKCKVLTFKTKSSIISLSKFRNHRSIVFSIKANS
ncbi:hypothetical protein FFZ95_14780 [Leptospira borgpetersenii]|nr:hypothetical protein FFZ95_14780 [Leptospira borgpetersenii]